MNCRKLLFSILVFAFAASVPVFGQYQLNRGSFGNGSAVVSGNNQMLKGSIGQATTGQTTNDLYRAYFGLQYGVGNVVVGIVPDDGIAPKAFQLRQNYPNPFNPGTTIAYDLPTAGQVRLTVYNILGQKIIRLVNKRQAAGSYRIEWNGLDGGGNLLPSAVYLYTFESNGLRQVRRMLLIK